jgi:hypothetical protein
MFFVHQAEGILETKLKAAHKLCAPADVTYEAFDFHKECSKMRLGPRMFRDFTKAKCLPSTLIFEIH